MLDLIDRDPLYSASPINPPANDNSPRRRRGTKAEMEERARFFIAYANINAPVTVRQLFYAATVHGVPGITKDDDGYNRVQTQVLSLRREGRLPYSNIADLTRFMRKPSTYDDVEDALFETARLYRRSLWRDLPQRVEIWCEKDALAGSIYPVTSKFDVPLMVCRGFSSETFAFEAVEYWAAYGKEAHVYHLGDFDRSGQDAADDLERRLRSFASGKGIELYFEKLALTDHMIQTMRLPTRKPKRETAADRRWPYDYACELDALPPATLRGIVDRLLDEYLPASELAILQAAEASERELLMGLARAA